MAQNMNNQEIDQLIKKLEEAGYIVKGNDKATLFRSEAEKAFDCRVFVMQDLRSHILAIADFLTDNYEKKQRNVVKRSNVPVPLEDEYRKIVSGILEVMRPYFGKDGFNKHL